MGLAREARARAGRATSSGHSLGGAIAVELARRRPEAAGLVLEATFTSVRDMIDQSPWGFLPVGLILTQHFDALSKIGEVRMPVLVIHGTRDTVVPVRDGRAPLRRRAGPKRFIRVEGAGHHNLSGRRRSTNIARPSPSFSTSGVRSPSAASSRLRRV